MTKTASRHNSSLVSCTGKISLGKISLGNNRGGRRGAESQRKAKWYLLVKPRCGIKFVGISDAMQRRFGIGVAEIHTESMAHRENVKEYFYILCDSAPPRPPR